MSQNLVYKPSKWHDYLWDSTESQDRANELSRGKKDFSAWDGFSKEVFSRLYSENLPKVEQVAPEHRWAEKAHDLCDEIPEFETLRRRCRGDKLWSSMGAMGLLDNVYTKLPRPEDPSVKQVPKLRKQVQGLKSMIKQGMPLHQELEQAEQALTGAEQASEQYAESLDPSAVRQAIRAGVESANEKIDEFNEFITGFGYGDGAGMADGKGGDVVQKQELFRRVSNSAKLRQIAELAGKLRMSAAQKQRSKAQYARDEISDVVQGDDLARLLPSESVKLASPLLKKLFYKGLLEKTLLCYELRGTDVENKGPIVVCVDNSGSMSGDPEVWSKGVALALLDIAMKQKRAFYVVHFDGKVQMTFSYDPKASKTVSYPELLSAMEFFSGGGTNFEAPLVRALEVIKTASFKKADVILITDGSASNAYAEEYRAESKKLEITTYGIMIGDANEARVLREYCDNKKVVCVGDTTGTNDGTDMVFEI